VYQAPEQFIQLGKSNLEAALSIASLTLQTTEKLIDLQMRTAKDALDQGVKSAKAFAEVKNVQDLMALQSASTQPGIEKMLAFSRSLYDVASDTQSKVTKIVESRVAEVSGGLMAAVEQVAKNAPAGTEGAMTAFKSAIAAANNAYDTMTKVARQAGEATANAATAATAPAKNGRRKAH
jgi:phasin family protein